MKTDKDIARNAFLLFTSIVWKSAFFSNARLVRYCPWLDRRKVGRRVSGRQEFANWKVCVTFIALVSTGCVPMGMGMHGKMMEQMMPATSDRVQSVNMGQAIDEMIEEAVADISSQNFEISSIAVWRIKSHTAGLDVEMIRRKLISRLVVLNRFKVLSRERLEEVLEEQSLSLSGAIDERSAVDIGQLIGVEGFIDGYASIEDNRFMLNLSLVETKSGVIVWAKIIGRDVQ